MPQRLLPLQNGVHADGILDQHDERGADIADDIRRTRFFPGLDAGAVGMTPGETKETEPPPGSVGVVRRTMLSRTTMTPDAPGPPGNLCGDRTIASFAVSPSPMSIGR